MPDNIGGKYSVGGVLLDRPFKIRRLEHFGINAIRMGDWPDAIEAVSDSFMGEPFLGPLG